jgi:hypothetical protein
MPYIRSNWEGIDERNGGGKFPMDQVASVDNARLQKSARGGARTCFVHGESNPTSRAAAPVRCDLVGFFSSSLSPWGSEAHSISVSPSCQ